METTKRNRGFSMIELLVALAVGMVVLVQVLTLFASQQRNAVAQKDVVEIQEDSRMVADMLSIDLRMAGFMVPNMVAVSSRDGSTNAPDALCVSDAESINPTTLAASTTRFDGASFVGNVVDNDSNLVMVSGDLDVDGDGNDDFGVGGGLIISDGTRTHCARITAISGNSVTFTPATPNPFLVSSGDGRAAPAVIYEVTGNGLERNGMIFAQQVEDLQVEFGVDVDGDGQIAGAEFPVHTIDNSDTAAVREVRLSVVVRTDRDDMGFTGGGRPAVANRVAGSADTFRRRLITNMIAPRNLL